MTDERTLDGLLVGDLAAAQRAGQIEFVRPEQSMVVAITKMISNDFSQLPVVRSDRDVPGVLTWRAVGKVWMGKCDDREVKDFMDTPTFVSVDDPILDLINEVNRRDFVLVRDATNRLSGIVTSADISEEFHKIGEPFLLVGAIERGLRRLIRPYFNDEAVTLILNGRRANTVDELVFGELHELLSSSIIWSKLAVSIDQRTFTKDLGEVIELRNKLVHARICYLGDDELRLVRRFERWVRDLTSVAVSNPLLRSNAAHPSRSPLD